MREGVLRYDIDLDRWCFDEGEARESLHCGEAIAVRIAGRYYRGRIEMDRHGDWIFMLRGKAEALHVLRRSVWYSARMIE